MLKIDGSLARNIDFEVANFQVLRKTRRKTSIFEATKCEKLEEVSYEMLVFVAPRCLVSRLWFSRGLAVSMGGSCKNCLFVMMPTLKIAGSLVRNARFFCTHVSRLESLVFLWRRRVYVGSRKTSPFSKVSKEVVMSFCVAGVALCDIPTCLIMCQKCQNWRKSRTKCWFFCIHVSCLESLVFPECSHVC